MTIKQLGGVFGRNPTFNDVTIEGELTFDGDIDVNSDLTVDGDLEVTGPDGRSITLKNTNGGAATGDLIGQVLFYGSDASSPGAGVKSKFKVITDGGSADGSKILISTSDGVTNDIDRMEFTKDGDVKVLTGNLVIGTSGQGIDFSATGQAPGMTSELLDDYEEGTWTPTVRGTTAGTYTLADVSAYYTKIGNQVTITAYFGFSAASGGTSLMRIENIPFAYKGYSVFQGAVRHGNITLTTADADVTVGPRFFNLNTAFTDLFLFESTGGSASVGVQISGISTSSTVAFTATYTVE
jgi:hypothetical protein